MTVPYDGTGLAPVDLDEPSRSSVRRVRQSIAEGTAERADVATLRGMIARLDSTFEKLARDPGDSACPTELAEFADELRAFQQVARAQELSLLGRIVARQLAFVERLLGERAPVCLLAKLALEELLTVFDMVLDVVELVGSDSGCRHEERLSLRILASVAPQILAEVDGSTFREIRFHQVSTRTRSAAAS
jgi:hypothetical protein